MRILVEDFSWDFEGVARSFSKSSLKRGTRAYFSQDFSFGFYINAKKKLEILTKIFNKNPYQNAQQYVAF